MKRIRSAAVLAALLAAPAVLSAQQRGVAKPAAPLPLKLAPRPTVGAITAADAMTRLYQFADDSMGGRQVGEIGHVKGTDYLAAELTKMGLKPLGENGTYFQTLPVSVREFDRSATLSINGRALSPDADFLVRDQGPGSRSLEGTQVVYGGFFGDTATMIAPAAAAGKLVVLQYKAPAGTPIAPNRGAVNTRYLSAAGLAIVTMDLMPAAQLAQLREAGGVFMEGGETTVVPTYFYVTKAAASLLMGGANLDSLTRGAMGPTVQGTARFVSRPSAVPVRNVIAVVPGSDPKLKDEYVVIGAHSDHVGSQPQGVDHDSAALGNRLFRKGGADDAPVRMDATQLATLQKAIDSVRASGRAARRDSIFNGADDDGSGSVGLLEIAQALATQKVKPKRSMLLVWHAGEEMGLWGSEYYTDHPTVPREQIVAALNIDMIGRGMATDVEQGGPGYLQVIGSRRLSTELGDLLESVNTKQKHGFTFDYQFDANGHPQQYYCRSDHYNYARYGIPIVFLSSGGHADYHMVTDEPQYINYQKIAGTSSLIRDLGLRVANLDHRVVVDKPKPDPKGQCVQ